MGIRGKILWILGGVLLLVMGTIFSFSYRIIIDGFRRVEQQSAALFIERTQQAVQDSVSSVSEKLIDWASWDDTYEYLVKRDPAYLSSNWKFQSFSNLNMRAGLLFDLKRRPVIARAYDHQSKKTRDQPKEFLDYFQRNPHLIEKATLKEGIDGIASIAGSLYIISGRPVLDSEELKPARGALFFIRAFDEALIETLHARLKVPVSISWQDELPTHHNVQPELLETSDSVLHAQYASEDINGQPHLQVMLELPRDALRVAKLSLTTFGIMLLLTSGLAVLLVMHLMNRSLLMRIVALREFVLTTESEQTFGQVFPVRGNDEIDQLAKAFNRLTNYVHLDRMALKESQDRLQLALDASSGGVWDWDLSTNHVRFDAKYMTMLGYSSSELPPSLDTFKNLLHPDDLEPTMRAAKTYIEGRLPHFSVEFRMKSKDGSYRWILSEGAMRRDHAGQGIRFVGWHRDITEQKLQRDLIDHQKLQLAHSAKMSALGEMSGGVAHEINNPLAVIHGSASQIQAKLEKGDLSLEKIQKYLTNIMTMADRIANIIKSLRSFARDGSADPRIATSLQGILSDCLVLAQDKLKLKSIALNISEISPHIQVSVRASEIFQIVINLLNNALDAVAPMENGWISLKVEETDENVLVIVENAGAPIPEEIQAKLFQPFFTTKDVGKGTGLGLSISKGLAEANDGKLWYDGGCPHPRFILSLKKFTSDQTSENLAV